MEWASFASALIRQTTIKRTAISRQNARILRREVKTIVRGCECRLRYAYFELTHWSGAVFGFSMESFKCVAARISALSPASERVLQLVTARADA